MRLTGFRAAVLAGAVWLAAIAPAFSFDEHSLVTGQVSVLATSATKVVAQRPGRTQVTITNTTTTPAYCGGTSLAAAVSTTTGDYLAGVAGSQLIYFTDAEVDCISSSGTITVTYSEVF